jgi:hypothetical protein
MEMSDIVASVILATPLTLLVLAGWDTARRHYATKSSEAIRLAADYAAKLEKRVAAVEDRARAQESSLDLAHESLTKASFSSHQWADQASKAAGHVAKLDERVGVLEKGQRELALRLDAPHKISKFQRG